MRRISTLAVAAVLTALTGGTDAATLITDDEAKLPSAPALTQRGISRGPTVKVVSPTGNVASPFPLAVRFEAHGGAKVEPNSVKVTYMRQPAVDITERVRPFITAAGIDMSKAEVPPGDHGIRIEVKDSDGRQGSIVISVAVPKK